MFSFLVVNYMKLYCQLGLLILLRLDFFTRTSEMARLYGIQVYLFLLFLQPYDL